MSPRWIAILFGALLASAAGAAPAGNANVVRDLAASHPVGFTVSRPVEGDQPNAKPVQHGGPRVRAEPAARGPVQEEHWSSVGIAVDLGRYSPAVSRSYRSLQDRPLPLPVAGTAQRPTPA